MRLRHFLTFTCLLATLAAASQNDSSYKARKTPSTPYSALSLSASFNNFGIDSNYKGSGNMITLSHMFVNKNTAFGLETGLSRVRKAGLDTTFRCLMLPLVLVNKINLSGAVFLTFDAGVQIPLVWDISTVKDRSFKRVEMGNNILPMCKAGVGFYLYDWSNTGPFGELQLGYINQRLNLPHKASVGEKSGFVYIKLGMYIF